LQVATVGVPIKPGLSLGGYVAFAKYDDATMESELVFEPIPRLVSSWLHVCAIPSDSQP
jgi:hypothetical protein